MVIAGPPKGNKSTDEKLIPVIEKNIETLRRISPDDLGQRSGVRIGKNGLLLDAFFQTFVIDTETFAITTDSGTPVPLLFRSIALTYLAKADGTPPSNKLIHFRELPGGGNYASAFQGYAPNSLTRHFGQDIDGFIASCKRVGGRPAEFGDAAFTFDLFPKIPITVIYYLGEEAFPPAASLLFDANVHHYMVTDGLATVGKRLVDIIIENHPENSGSNWKSG